ncbi:MAG: DNA repair exonuclease [Hyphomicrobium sp.]
MTFTFIHTADWQLGKPFANFPSDLAGELAAARFSASGRIAAIAEKRGARHVLVAGDIFDAEDLSTNVLRRAMELMAVHASITWVLLPGNHDPARHGGVWDRVQRFGAPGNVVLALTDGAITLGDGVAVLAAPLTSKNPGRDPTQWMDAAPTADGTLRIGLAHGSVQGFGSNGESSVLIARNRAETAGLAYLALGDWHGTTRVGPDTWYSGTPEPDRFPSNEPGHVLAVSVARQGAVNVERIASADFAWARLAATVNTTADLSTIEAQFAALGGTQSRALVRLALSGSLSLSEHADFDAWQEVWSARLRYLEVDAVALAVRPTETDFDSLGSDGPLVEAARKLAAVAANPAHADAAVAALALQRLFGFAAEAAREAGT